MEIERYYKILTESLKLLSLDFDEQKDFFPEFVDVPFEILDSFQNAFILLPQILEAKRINCDVMPDLLRLNNLINSALAHPDFDTLEALEMCTSENWEKIREISKLCLIHLKEPLTKPNSKYL
ncbi:hypothetical protein MKQ68_09850 [Chitinophaga horti]|uniref:Uncharacterized protein n=1 Tax=Chitinophaga horti TaxID=2920382 RepID=A0ABY6J6V3_9BACT|nr:hypothetical protein [Chitinophaga horti]UYQ95400.1 hypothetical protein MKQ68_09850 [Chitinophaga horti]